MSYSNVHAVVGTGVVLAVHAITGDTTTAVVLGGAGAAVSHDALDRLGEASYGDKLTTIQWELYPLWIFAMVAYFSGNWELYAVGWIAGNLYDIVDKKLYLSILWPERFGPSWTFFRCHRRRPDIMLTLRQTKLLTIASSILILGGIL